MPKLESRVYYPGPGIFLSLETFLDGMYTFSYASRLTPNEYAFLLVKWFPYSNSDGALYDPGGGLSSI